MALDYRARKHVSRNRPRRRPIKLFFILIFAGISAVYGLGVVTGWLFFKYKSAGDRQPAAVATASTTARQEPGREASTQNAPPQETSDTHVEVPMTFFKTLPSGEKGVIGSGINLQQDGKHQQAGSAAAPTSAADSRPRQPPKTEDKPAAPETSKAKSVQNFNPAAGHEHPPEQKSGSASEHPNQPGRKETWSVQVASYQDRTEAEELAAKLQKKGLSPRIVESKIPGKGVWYRVRVGKGMERDGADKMATGLGKNAIAIPE